MAKKRNIEESIAKIGGILPLPAIVPDTKDPALWAEYAAILRRVESPLEADGDQLVQIAKRLELSSEEVELHLLVLAERTQLEEEQARLPERQKAFEENKTAREKNWAEYVNALEKYAANAEKFEIKNRTLQREMIDCQQISGNIFSLENGFPGLFGIDFKDVQNGGYGYSVEIRNLMSKIEQRKEAAKECQPQPRRRRIINTQPATTPR